MEFRIGLPKKVMRAFLRDFGIIHGFAGNIFWILALGPRAVETGLLPPGLWVKRIFPCSKDLNAPIRDMSQFVLIACAPLLQAQ